MSGQALVSVHLPVQMLRDLDAAVKAGVFRCRSEAVRIAVKKLLESYGLGADADAPPCYKPAVARRRRAAGNKTPRVHACNGRSFEELWGDFIKRVVEIAKQYKSDTVGVVPYYYVLEKCGRHSAHTTNAIVKVLKEIGCVKQVVKTRRRLKVLLDKKCVEEIKSVENIAKDKLDT